MTTPEAEERAKRALLAQYEAILKRGLDAEEADRLVRLYELFNSLPPERQQVILDMMGILKDTPLGDD